MPNENRKLASVQRIEKVDPVKDADRLEVATVLGWEVVVGKGDFKPGDKIVFFEIDSFLPMKDEFEFLKKFSYKNNELNGEGYRIKSKKIRGQMSQGLIMSLDSLGIDKDTEIGTDLTKELDVNLYMTKEVKTGQGLFLDQFHPKIQKTDEIRVQSEPERLTALQGKPYYITEKVDGTSTTISYEKDEGIKCFTRNTQAVDTEPNFLIDFFDSIGLIDALKENNKNIYFQGELHGPKIQKNRLKKKEISWLFFNIGYIDGNSSKRVPFKDWDKFFEENEKLKDFKNMHVKVLEEGDNFQYNLEELKKISVGNYDGAGQREGIVIRPQEDIEYNDEPLSMKVINDKYLLKNEN